MERPQHPNPMPGGEQHPLGKPRVASLEVLEVLEPQRLLLQSPAKSRSVRREPGGGEVASGERM